MNTLENKLINEWLDECRSPNTRRTYVNRIQRFFNWYGLTIEDFLKLSDKEKRHTALKFQNEHPDENPNSVIGDLTALNSFLHYLDMPIDFKGKRVRPRPDLDSHIFSNGDLSKMFEVGGTKEKAVIALACSLGWEVSAILELDRQTLTSLVARARSEKQRFIFFNSQRRKTGALRLGVLNPLALEWLEKWLTESNSLKARRRKEDRKTKDRVVSPVFDLTAEGVNKMLRRLAKEAQTVTTGRVHFHKIRGWVMSGLSRAGFNEFEVKFLMGKSIPLSDLTYLQTLGQAVEDKYPKAFESYLNVKPEKVVQVIDETLKLKVQEQAQRIDELQRSLAHLVIASSNAVLGVTKENSSETQTNGDVKALLTEIKELRDRMNALEKKA